jgi:hypothetical protein
MIIESVKAAELQKPVVWLSCCCCGASTLGRQWHNRDTGYGLCDDCIEFCHRGETADSFQSLYGMKGVHYSVE